MVKNLPAIEGDLRDSQKIPWRRHSNLLQYPCLENPMGRGALLATAQRVAKS